MSGLLLLVTGRALLMSPKGQVGNIYLAHDFAKEHLYLLMRNIFCKILIE